MTHQIHIPHTAALADAAQHFLQTIGDAKLLAFYGAMGVGKTTFVKAICEALGVQDVVNSPTFAIVNEYTDAQGEAVYHFDFYRIKKQAELFDLGFDNYLDSGCFCLMEWPELVEELLPDETLRITLVEQADGSRMLTFDC
jgi:tRNA threonylcarbamoyladenosine biosynthesis protein TsaE